jgi:hypothetical protein
VRIDIPKRWQQDNEEWVEQKKRTMKVFDRKYYEKLNLLSKSLSKCNLMPLNKVSIEHVIENLM